MIKHNPKRVNKVLRTENEEGDKVNIWKFSLPSDEITQICQFIKQLKDSNEVSLDEIAILSRTN